MFTKAIAIASHPPIIVPEVGGGREMKAQATIDGMRELGRRIAGLKPQTIICITPHGNAFRDGMAVTYEPKVKGDFSAFGVPEVGLEKECDMTLLDEMNYRFAENEDQVIFLNDRTAAEYHLTRELDHGCLVPLYYLDKYHSDYKIVHITISGLGLMDHYRLGRSIREAAETVGRDTVILASADLSHALKSEGPYEFNAMGPIFDEQIVTALNNQNYYEILTMDSAIYEPAAQCGLKPIITALGATDEIRTKSAVFSYEGPFGVGYLSSLITFDLDQEDPTIPSLIPRAEDKVGQDYEKRIFKEDAYITLARQTIEHWVEKSRKLALADFIKELSDEDVIAKLTTTYAGTFVSIHEDGALRGCIGTTGPTQDNLGEEIIRNAIQASTYDPRFGPIEASELKALEISVDVLGPTEDIESITELDPHRYGVIVEKDLRRGLLLPNLDGIDTAEEQVNIAKQKAGIFEADDEGGPLMLKRFEVIRHEVVD